MAGIGCHYMVVWMDREHEHLHPHGRRRRRRGSARRRSPTKSTCSPISATAPTSTPACWRSARRSRPRSNITYKILYNDAVAMTGGQPVDGVLDRAADLAPDRRRRRDADRRSSPTSRRNIRPNVRPGRRASTMRHRNELDEVQRELREMSGRVGDPDLRPDLRVRKAPPPEARRVSRSGQARGDQRSGVRRLRRLLGASRTACRSNRSKPNSARKRQINQSSCNKDFSCVNGFCPSFVTVEGGQLKKPKRVERRARRDARRCRSPTLPDDRRARTACW